MVNPAPSAAATPAIATSASSTLRRSTRSARKSPYFSSAQGTRRLGAKYRLFSSLDDGNAIVSDVVSSMNITVAAKNIMKSGSSASSNSNSSKQSKRKANKSPSRKSKKAKTKSTAYLAPVIKVERTRSFEPAWWGNVLQSTNTLHSHVAAAMTVNTAPINKSTNLNQRTLYPPVHTLILGTHPSITSLDKNEMYGHPLNAFWYLAGDALGFRRSPAISPKTGKPYVYYHDHLRHGPEDILEYSQQLERMVSRGFAVWDIIAECEREGSLDTAIEGEVANPIREFCEGTLQDSGGDSNYLGIQRIVIANGTTGSKFFVKHFTQWFVDGKLCAAKDEMSQRVFKVAMNKARKANGRKLEDDIDNRRLIEVVCLPGVSPAAAKFTYLEKRNAWEKGCYGPGLVDYDVWKESTQQTPEKVPSQTTTPLKRTKSNTRQTTETVSSSEITPTKRTKSKSPRKAASPSPPKTPAIRLVSSDMAKLAPENEWVDLNVIAEELRPSATLTTGQCFNWLVVETKSAESAEQDTANESPRKQSAWGTHDAKEWVGPLHNRVISIRETPTSTHFRVLHGPTARVKEDLQNYFRLETPLAPLYEKWSEEDARLAKIAKAIPGVRILRQDPLECMMSFICSSNNNIPRIAKMISSFREKYGSHMLEIPTLQGDDNCAGALSLYSFPTLASLADATEDELRGMGYGYRAKYIIETRNLLIESGGNDFLLKLRGEADSQAVQDELTKFSGIGRKVADCVALFSLDQDDAIPVDVHVQHIASRDYDPTVLGEAKSITPTIYKRVGDLFRDRFSSYPGWAHSLLFVAELPSFREVLPTDVVREMDEWKEHEQRKKQEKKEESKKSKGK